MPREIYKFPIEDEDEYQGRIIFESYQENYQSLGEIGLAASSIVNTRFNEANDVNSRFDYPPTSAKGAVKNFNGDNLKTIQSNLPDREDVQSLQLYLPQTIQFADAVEYTNVDLGMLGGAAALALRNNASGAENAKKVFQSSLPSLESLQDAVNVGLKSEAAQVAALRVAGRISSGVQGAIETETGITLNPNRRSTLRGIGIRRFRFSFNLIPSSQREANRITEIIKWFRLAMYPSVGESIDAGLVNQTPGISASLKFPRKFNIKLRYADKPIATGILPCFLEAFDVVYNPNAMAFHTDGNFQETTISLSFIEERALVKSDIQGGF